jgi:hypothetical protein
MPGATFNLPLAYAAFGVRVANGAMNAAGANPRILTSATANFSNSDVGKRIVVAGAGAAGADLDTFIARRLSGTQVLLKAPALTTVAGANVSYVQGVYRLSQIIAGGDVQGNHYEFLNARRLQIQLGAASPGGILYIGGPYVAPTNAGIELNDGESDNHAPGTIGLAVTTGDYLTSDTADQKVNLYWIDDFNLSTPAP